MDSETRYTPTERGFAINGSAEIFNRTLYGSHASDDTPERFFTFAGDTPLFMGTVTDWTKNNHVCNQEKCGVLCSGLAITRGKRDHFYYSPDIDQTSRWFHTSADVRAEFTNGHMEYELAQISSWFPDVRVKIEAYPLLPEDGYLIHYHITTDQHVFFVAGFGGLTDKIGRFEMPDEKRRYFSAADTVGNTVTVGKNRACVRHTDGKTMRIATSFDADFGIGSAKAMAEPYAGMFMASEAETADDCVVKISAAIDPGKTLDGYLVAVFGGGESVLDKWLSMENPMRFLQEQIAAKYACIDVSTPEHPLDLTVAPTVIAMDSAWHKDSFHHGAFAYHTPFLGWRNWYAPTVLGWGERVARTMEKYLSLITRGDVKDEKLWYDATPTGEGKSRFDGRFHHLENTVGRLPSHFNMDGTPRYGPYNMQECALDMMLYYIEWTGDLAIAEKYYDELCSMVEWEARIFDPDGDGLYQSVLNTWISDGHNYNGGGCAQSSAYNYRANAVMAKIAAKLGKDGTAFAERAGKIKKALNEKLWIANRGVIAEYLDTVGNRLIHPSVELPTVYHVMDSAMIDDFRAYRTLKFTENHLKNITMPGSNGRLCYSSAWLPKQYSNCGIFPAENAHLALVYFKLGLKEAGKKLLDGIAGCYFTGKNPGLAAHIQSARGASDFGDIDFSDVNGTYLRLIVEGLFGIRINYLDGVIAIEPGFPREWEHASLSLKDIAVQYHRKGEQEIFEITCERTEKKVLRIPMRSASVDAVLLDGKPISYAVKAAPNHSFLTVEVEKTGRFQLRVLHGDRPIPKLCAQNTVLAENRIVFTVEDGTLQEVFDVSEALDDIRVVGNKVYATAKNLPGDYTLFLRVTSGDYDAWLAADYEIVCEEKAEEPLAEKPFEPIDIGQYFNCNMTEVHEKDYLSPRPEGFSMSLYKNARYSHNWNQYGRHVAYVDDRFFRNAGGQVVSPSGIPFATPEMGENLACVSIYDTFPTELSMPLSGKGQELAVLFVASTYCLQTGVENARIAVTYADGTKEEKPLVYPMQIDDWLTSALTDDGEVFYFSDFNHATVQRLRLNPSKELASVTVKAVANEVILGVAGISISR